MPIWNWWAIKSKTPITKIKKMVTSDNLSKIAPTIKADGIDIIANALDKICPLYGISTPDIFHEFIANVLHESNEFTTMEENLNYKTQALIDLFSRSRISIEDANKYGRNAAHPADKVEIANHIYGGQWGKVNLGNTKPMDGWIFRGSGAIQATGRNNIAKFTQYYNHKFNMLYTPEDMANLLRTDIEISIHSACWFFSIAKKLIQAAIDDNMNEIVKKINGGHNGINERNRYYELAKKYIV